MIKPPKTNSLIPVVYEGGKVKGNFPAKLTEMQWKKKLNISQYAVLREGAMEKAFENRYWNNNADGLYKCAGCDKVIFSSKDKYDAGRGCCSFTQPAVDGRIGTCMDATALKLPRLEVHCSNCGGHLGFVFDDGPEPCGLRYCISSAALNFEPAEVPVGAGDLP